MGGNDNGLGGGQQKPLLWKEPNFNGDEVKMDQFRATDKLTWDQEVKD